MWVLFCAPRQPSRDTRQVVCEITHGSYAHQHDSSPSANLIAYFSRGRTFRSMGVCFLKRLRMPSHPLSFFLLDLLSFECPDVFLPFSLPTICALAATVSNAIAIAASNPLHFETVRYLEKRLPNLINRTSPCRFMICD